MPSPISDAMAGMTPEEKAAYKAQQYGIRPTPDSMTAGTRMVAITDGPTFGYLDNSVFNQTAGVPVIRCVIALWEDAGVGFELVDLSAANPFYFRNPPILIDDPNGDIVRTWTNPDGSTGTRTLTEDPDQALMQACMDSVEGFHGTGGEM